MRRTIVGLALLVLVAGLVGAGLFTKRWLTGPTCVAEAGGTSFAFTPEQLGHASTITSVALTRGLPARAATIALATAIQESGLRNLDHGDRDSVGLFQQRPSQGWGSVAEIMDPVYSAGKFYDALVKVDDYESRPITEVAQEVQRSAYPDAYADHEAEGRALASTLAGHSPAGLACRLDDAGEADGADEVVAALREDLGMTAQVEDGTVVVHAGSEQKAWQAGAWAVASAHQRGITEVTVGDRTWQRSGGDALTWVAARAATNATTVTITLA